MESEKEIFVLGAGASACFGLPMWNELAELILEKLVSKKNEEGFDQFTEDHYSKATEWIEKTNPDTEEKGTIDYCMHMESEKLNQQDSDIVIDLIFNLIKDIFVEKKESSNKSGVTNHVACILINYLTDKYTMNYKNLSYFLNRKVFIDFNYDDLLSGALQESITRQTDLNYERNKIVNAAKDGVRINSEESRRLIQEVVKTTKNIYKPHGCFNQNAEFLKNSNTYQNFLKEEPINYSCAFCHDCKKDRLCFKSVSEYLKNATSYYINDHGTVSFKKSSVIYILGVGPTSLKYNLDKIDFPENFPLRKVVYTCFEDKDNSVYRDYFAKKFGSEDKVEYVKIKKCEDLKGVYEFAEKEPKNINDNGLRRTLS